MNYLLMYSPLTYYEIKMLSREKLLLTLVVATLIFSGFSLVNGYRWTIQQQAVIAAAQQEQLQAIEQAEQAIAPRKLKTKPINWWDDVTDLRGYAFYLMVNYALKPPQAMAPVAVGQSDVLPYFFRMTVGKKQDFIHQHETVHPLLLYLGKFDFAFFTLYLLPLLLIAAGYSAVSREKQSGQLRLLMIQGLSPLRLLRVQLAVRSAIIILPTISVTLLFLLLFQPGVTVFELFSLTLVLLGYALFWVALTALVISMGKTAAYNATMLITGWLVLVIIIPALGNSWLQWTNPPPSRIEYVDTLRRVSDQTDKESAKALARFFQDHPELSNGGSEKPTDDYSMNKLAAIAAIEKAMQPTEDAFSRSLSKQQSLSEGLRYFSPASIVQSALYQLAGSGVESHRRFINQTERYHLLLRDYFQTRIVEALERGDFSPCQGCNANITFVEFSTMPRFHYRPGASAIDWRPLGFFGVVILGMCGIALMRMRDE